MQTIAHRIFGLAAWLTDIVFPLSIPSDRTTLPHYLSFLTQDATKSAVAKAAPMVGG
jgi:hypothetical protein